ARVRNVIIIRRHERPMMHPRVAASVVVMLFVAAHPAWAQRMPAGAHWVATWTTALVARASQPGAPADGARAGGPGGGAAQQTPRFNNQTLRQIVHVSLGGDRLRVVVS